MEKKELVRFYFDTLALNDHLMQWYRAFFLAFEAIIFAGVWAIYAYPDNSFLQKWILGLAITGLWVSIFAVGACVQRGRIVDRQKRKIQALLWDEEGKKIDPNDELAECFKVYHPKKKSEKWVPRLIFNVFLHILIGGGLIFVVGVSEAVTPGWIWVMIPSYVVFLILAYWWLGWLGVPHDLFEQLKWWEKILP